MTIANAYLSAAGSAAGSAEALLRDPAVIASFKARRDKTHALYREEE